MIFHDRRHAGRLLAEKLMKYKDRADVLLVAVLRGGLEVAKEMSSMLNLEVVPLIVKKLGSPFNPEYGIGAIDMDGELYLSEIAKREAEEDYINEKSLRLKEEIKQMLDKYGLDKNTIEKKIKNKNCIVVDDGLATGLTMIASAKYLKRHLARSAILAVPLAPPDSLARIKKFFDEVICLYAPKNFIAVSQFYEKFPQLSDDDVLALMK